jgi:hypothetical protein
VIHGDSTTQNAHIETRGIFQLAKHKDVAISWPFDLENSRSLSGFPNTRNHAMWQQSIS